MPCAWLATRSLIMVEALIRSFLEGTRPLNWPRQSVKMHSSPSAKLLMRMDRDKFFAMLDQLTPSQIEARLSSWNDEQLKLVGEYLERRTMKPVRRKQVAHVESAAVAMASKANKMATVALIIAIGAMLAAIAAGLLALQR